MDLTVVPGSPAMLQAGHLKVRCVLGRGGVASSDSKREGDGATPAAAMAVRGVLLRPDAGITPPMALPWRWLRPADGWSDDPADPAYNQPVSHPHPFSAERLWREDHVYDVILVLDWNDAPPEPGRGSAIFWHLAHADLRPTEGCVAIGREDMALILPLLSGDARLRVRPPA
jgi:L,D-peptidoglycan transpeptidase YkuD (ErfK/YbiS/YcfS/YnhG family)